MAEGKRSFVVYTSWNTFLEELSDAQLGQWFRWVLLYTNDKKPQYPSDPVVKMACLMAKENLKRDLDKWEEQKKKRSDAGKKGMESRWHNNNANEPITNDNNVIENITNDNNVTKNDNNVISDITKITVNVNDNVNVNVNDFKNKRINEYKLESSLPYVQFLIEAKYIVEQDAKDIKWFENVFRLLDIKFQVNDIWKVLKRFAEFVKVENVVNKVSYLENSMNRGIDRLLNEQEEDKEFDLYYQNYLLQSQSVGG